MKKRPNKSGGGSKTNFNGLKFEGRTSLKRALRQHKKYKLLADYSIVHDGKVVAHYFEKHDIYSKLLKPEGIDYTKIISKKLLPDGAILVGNTIYIIEKKYQSGPGSVDEKLQTCDFKKKQYSRLFGAIGLKVEFYFVLNSWFNQDCYKDVFDYIVSVGCKYFIDKLPLHQIGLSK